RFYRFRYFHFRFLSGTIHPYYDQIQKLSDISSCLRQFGMSETGETPFYNPIPFTGFTINGSEAA
ncbi:hypothetical protein LIQ92_18310, partial [Fusicatenibacter saccharivorans]|nr:hypothetical protein [Fusicatenibacter saccharivorans]